VPLGFVLDGMLLGGSVLGVALPGAQGFATVAEVPLVDVVPAAPVELPAPDVDVVPELVLLGVEVVLPVPLVPVGAPVLLPVVVLQGPTVPAVVPFWLGVVVVLWLGVVVVDCEGVVPGLTEVAEGVVWVADGVVWVAEGVVWLADGVPIVPAPPGVVVVEVVPVCVPDVPAVPVAVPDAPVLPVVWAAATPIASVSANEASKILCMNVLLGSALTADFLSSCYCSTIWDASPR
jgi:hypothetical protein